MHFRTGAGVAMAALLACAVAPAQSPMPSPAPSPALRSRGEDVYKASCAACHDNPQERTPGRNAIAITRSPDYLLRVLNDGVMQVQASALSSDDKAAVIAYLVNAVPGPGSAVDIQANHCSGARGPVTSTGPSWNSWGGHGTSNLRHQTDGGMAASSLAGLQLKWAFALPAGASSPPTVVGNRLFIPSMAGAEFSLDAQTGCTYWAVDVGAPTRTPVMIGSAGDTLAAFFGDNKGRIHAVDADTGRGLWTTQVETHAMTRLTGAPVLFEGRLYVPVSSFEEAPDPKYRCCTFRGSLVALDAATGRVAWKSYTLDLPAQPLSDGHKLGPSGVAIWHAPTIDVRRRLAYVTTGNLYTDPAVETPNAVVAFDLATGARRWVRQIHAHDVNVAGCWAPAPTAGGPNCPSNPGPDFDLGGPAMLVTTPDGSDRLIVPSKSGDVFGLDPDAGGAILWRTQLGRGSALGGVEWGGASDGVRAYFTIGDGNDIRLRGTDAQRGPARPGLHAVSPSTGALLWYSPAPAPVCGWGVPCSPAMTAAPLVTSDLVFAGSSDGHLRAFSPSDGRILWQFDTGRSFSAVNGITAVGGAIDHGGQVIAGDMLFVTSGGRARAGNVLLAFAVER
ncbi:MAG: PQQ-binding-like beta-propeller repeat protein [Acidobacteria bacterium]|nr:PQQ-binding-like beta-propeller repeat protein [Acidobacteriota bacterium]